jgi:hypothetical protein
VSLAVWHDAAGGKRNASAGQCADAKFQPIEHLFLRLTADIPDGANDLSAQEDEQTEGHDRHGANCRNGPPGWRRTRW